MMLALKSGPQIAAKVGNPAGLLCRRIWYSVGKSGVFGITEYRQGRPLSIIDKILEKQTHYTIAMGDLMRKLEDKQIHQKGRQNASAWSSEMKEETNHCLILYRHLILPDLSSKMRPCGGKRCTEEEEEALLYFIIYTIILLKSVCLSVFANCRSQFLLDRLGRCI